MVQTKVKQRKGQRRDPQAGRSGKDAVILEEQGHKLSSRSCCLGTSHGSLFSSEVVGHWPTRVEGAEAGSRVQMTMSVMEGLPDTLQGDSFIVSGLGYMRVWGL